MKGQRYWKNSWGRNFFSLFLFLSLPAVAQAKTECALTVLCIYTYSCICLFLKGARACGREGRAGGGSGVRLGAAALVKMFSTLHRWHCLTAEMRETGRRAEKARECCSNPSGCLRSHRDFAIYSFPSLGWADSSANGADCNTSWILRISISVSMNHYRKGGCRLSVSLALNKIAAFQQKTQNKTKQKTTLSLSASAKLSSQANLIFKASSLEHTERNLKSDVMVHIR